VGEQPNDDRVVSKSRGYGEHAPLMKVRHMLRRASILAGLIAFPAFRRSMALWKMADSRWGVCHVYSQATA
jgi:hypothetical protein